MNTSPIKNILLFLLALVFSCALMFAFTELPRVLDQILQNNVGFPGFDQGANEMTASMSDMYIHTLNLRIIGYISLGIIAI